MVNLSPSHQDILLALQARFKNDTLHGAFKDLPIEVYHHPDCPGISSTRIKSIVELGYHYGSKVVVNKTPAMEFGNDFHAYMQGPQFFAENYSIGKFHPEKKFLSYDDFAKITAMANNVHKHPRAAELLKDSQQEYTFFAKCPVTGILRKARPDLIKGNIIGDWKTAMDATRSGFSRQARKLLYRISAMYYIDVVHDATGADVNQFHYIVPENQNEHQVAYYEIHEGSLITAKDEITTALEAIATASKGGWTGFPLHQQPISI